MSYYSKSTHKSHIPKFVTNNTKLGKICLVASIILFVGTIAMHLYNHTVMEVKNHKPTYFVNDETCIYDTYIETKYVYGVNPFNNKTEFHFVNETKYVYGEHEVTHRKWLSELTLRNGDIAHEYRDEVVNTTVCLYKG